MTSAFVRFLTDLPEEKMKHELTKAAAWFFRLPLTGICMC